MRPRSGAGRGGRPGGPGAWPRGSPRPRMGGRSGRRGRGGCAACRCAGGGTCPPWTGRRPYAARPARRSRRTGCRRGCTAPGRWPRASSSAASGKRA
ncbi:ABC-type dipeptide/oligopeptide/nickel transport system, ATPase component (plasmid) [Methylobacterium aquaticum]|uniref:ABC-type dipeptide/oligopeptide/nickel transport system, ATPase component n=1 Tax=Methylobacterium aquaticum TaxID=270351 RepID=A0A0C6FXN3_9HYPH|nr:ABC-type dipeptide/oligopeptide/nickel transport system, ATPase component [Methylobacterium aquaticum]